MRRTTETWERAAARRSDSRCAVRLAIRSCPADTRARRRDRNQRGLLAGGVQAPPVPCMKRNVILLLSIAVAAVLVHAWVARMPAPSAPLLSAATAGGSQPGEQLGGRLARRTAGPLARPLAEPLEIAAVETGASAQDRDRQIALQIESALLSGDANRLETAFARLLPQLLRTEPGRLV